MRAIFGVLSLLIVLAVVGVLAKKQLATTTSQPPALQTPAIGAATMPTGTVKEQSLQVQQQYKQALESALQQARPQPEDK